MTDPIQPFREEFERCLAVFTAIEIERYGRNILHDMTLENVLPRVACAYKALQIAETEGPDQALLWKLAND